jgi:hypothetical protein
VKSKAPKFWKLAKVQSECRFAGVVWCGLLELAKSKESPVVPTSRAELSTVTGITRLKTISEALTALEAAGWIKRVYAKKTGKAGGVVQLMKVILLYEGRQAPSIGANRMRGGRRPTKRGGRRPSSFPTEKGDGTGTTSRPAPIPIPDIEKYKDGDHAKNMESIDCGF